MSEFGFPNLRIKDILLFFRDINVDVIESDFRKPDPLRWRQIYGIILELLTNISPDLVYQNCLQCLMVKSADVFEYSELHNESLPIGALLMSLQRIMITCGIKDFSVQDNIDPTIKRLQRICSSAINLYKFRDSRVNVFSELREENKKYKEVYDELRQSINKHKLIRAEQEPENRKNQDAIELLTSTMDAQHKKSAVMQKEIQEIKTDLAEKRAKDDQLKVEIINKEKQIEMISQKIVQSPEKLIKELDRKHERLISLKEEINEKRNGRTEWGRQADKSKVKVAKADKLLKLQQSCKQEIDQESAQRKEILQNADQYQELQGKLEELSTKRNQLEARSDSRQEIIRKIAQQFAIKRKTLNEQQEQVKNQKMLYMKKHNVESEQMEEILKQKKKVLNDLKQRDQKTVDRLSNINSLYVQLARKYQENNARFEAKWNKFQEDFF